MSYKRFLLLTIILLGCMASDAVADSWDKDNYKPNHTDVRLTETNLPIILIDTRGEDDETTIIHKDYRVPARMTIIHNQTSLNYADTVAHPNQTINYQGWVGIKYRGASSFTYSEKKPYSFKTLATNSLEGKKKKVELLGMPKDNDWVLLAPYHDRSCMRDVLMYELARPYFEFTPKARFCELLLDGIYYGIYILCEKAGKGENRLNLSKPADMSDELTGDYLLQIDRDDDPCFLSTYKSSGKYNYIQFKYPEYEDMADSHPEQVAYIEQQYHAMEEAFHSDNYADPKTGYRKYVDIRSFANYQLASELSMNVDAYRLSTNLYKRRDSVDPHFKTTLWDFNLAFGNNYADLLIRNNWIVKAHELWSWLQQTTIPFYWKRIMEDPSYIETMKEQWAWCRLGNYSSDHINQVIDSLNNELTSHDAIVRNFAAWPNRQKSVYLAPNIAKTHEGEVEFLREVLLKRSEWMDSQLCFDPQIAVRISPAGKEAKEIEGYYNLHGQRIDAPRQGFYIVRYDDGTSSKRLMR
jgi:hypothetical protein